MVPTVSSRWACGNAASRSALKCGSRRCNCCNSFLCRPGRTECVTCCYWAVITPQAFYGSRTGRLLRISRPDPTRSSAIGFLAVAGGPPRRRRNGVSESSDDQSSDKEASEAMTLPHQTNAPNASSQRTVTPGQSSAGILNAG